MKKFEFDAKKKASAIGAIESMCLHCEDHSYMCPLAVAMGELNQKYTFKNRPDVNYKDFEFPATKAREAISRVESMCLHCEDHTDECPIVKTLEILEHYTN